jgi:hypothetical protein
MAMTAEQRTDRARNAAMTRHHPGKTADDLAREAANRAIDEIQALPPQPDPPDGGEDG